MNNAQKIIVAIDTNEMSVAKDLLAEFKDYPIWVKVGMELFYSTGPEIINEAKKYGYHVFLDLKLHDIPNTVKKSLLALCRLPIDMINIHAAGGSEMMKEAAIAVKQSPTQPLLIAVTQLTSTSEIQMQQEQLIKVPLIESVLHYAKLAKNSGCHGVVCSAHEVIEIKKNCGKEFKTITPGIRNLENNSQDQKRVTTPKEALNIGTDFMVIGRPITEGKSPRKNLEVLLKGME